MSLIAIGAVLYTHVTPYLILPKIVQATAVAGINVFRLMHNTNSARLIPVNYLYFGDDVSLIDDDHVEYTCGNNIWYRDGQIHRDGDLPAMTVVDSDVPDNADGTVPLTRIWCQRGLRHRDGDQPAIEFADGDKAWYYRGVQHRLGGPAHLGANGDYIYMVNGRRHRVDGPAMRVTIRAFEMMPAEEFANDANRVAMPLLDHVNEEWYYDGELHRDDGPAYAHHYISIWYDHGRKHRDDGPAAEWRRGDKEWWINGMRHRVNGPAIEFANGKKEWYRRGKLHRLDGPAMEYANGGQRWYKEGKLHRVGGPAIISATGGKKWYVDGQGLPR